MADKKERILIRKISVCEDSRNKELDWQDCRCAVRPNGFCEYHPKSKDTIPYQKAVIRMAKILCKRSGLVPCKNCTGYKNKEECLRLLKRLDLIGRVEALLKYLVEATK